MEKQNNLERKELPYDKEITPIWETEEYTYEGYGFIPTVSSYIHRGEGRRRGLLIVPGGGYRLVSPSEGEIVAEKFFEMGYNTFVLTYTTACELDKTLLRQPLYDLARAVAFVKEKADEWNMDGEKIGLCGFSAGGHLCASLGVHWNDEDVKRKAKSNDVRPDFMMLCYPVISAGQFAHQGSFDALCKDDGDMRKYFSVENFVDENTPPVFLWHTMDDASVPVENSILFAQMCRRYHVPVEMHLFQEGKHGLSLADQRWAEGLFSGLEVAAQQEMYISHCELAGVRPDVRTAGYAAYIKQLRRGRNLMANMDARDHGADRSISLWPVLAHRWITETGRQEY